MKADENIYSTFILINTTKTYLLAHTQINLNFYFLVDLKMSPGFQSSTTCRIWGHLYSCDRPHHLIGRTGQQRDAGRGQYLNGDFLYYTPKSMYTHTRTHTQASLTWPLAVRCAKINASLPGGRTPLTLPIICLLFLPRFDGVGMTTAGGIAMSSFLSVSKKKR